MKYRSKLAIALLVCVLITGGILFVSGCSNKKKDHHDEREAAAVAIATKDWGNGSWLPTSTGANCPIGRDGHSTIWTGSKMIIWGGRIGYDKEYLFTNSGAIYDPDNDSWTPTSTGSGCPSPRWRHTAVWTGDKMIVWGGSFIFNGSWTSTDSGAIYDPGNDSWTTVSTGPGCPSARDAHAAVWTGSEMIVFGTSDYDDNTGGIYDPGTDSWTPTATGNGCPPGGAHFSAFWTGSEMIVWGVSSDGPKRGIYDPDTGTWTPISLDEDRFYCTEGVAAVWTGSKLIIWGGMVSLIHYTPEVGNIYDPQSDTWSDMATGNACPCGRWAHSLVWADGVILAWGGVTHNDPGHSNRGGIYNPETDSWTCMYYGDGTPAGRCAHSAVWTGNSMIIWGGKDFEGNYINSGGIFTLPDP